MRASWCCPTIDYKLRSTGTFRPSAISGRGWRTDSYALAQGEMDHRETAPSGREASQDENPLGKHGFISSEGPVLRNQGVEL